MGRGWKAARFHRFPASFSCMQSVCLELYPECSGVVQLKIRRTKAQLVLNLSMTVKDSQKMFI